MSRARVLVIDDERHIVELARMYLEQAGYSVESAREGQEALTSIRHARPALVVLDLMLPGLGMPAEELSRIFERFYQVEKSRARQDSGAGLGLAIAREIVEGHGGRIRAESVQGLGTRMILELPVRAA